MPLHGGDWQPAPSQTVWECWINTRSEKLGTSELEFGASDEKMHVGERCSLFWLVPGSAFRRVLCQLPGREQVILVSRDFPTALLSLPSPGELNFGATSIPLVVAID